MPDLNQQAPTNAAPPDPIPALIAKHRVEIDRIKGLSSADQQAVFGLLGVNPEAVIAHYQNLAQRDIELRRQDTASDTKTMVAGWLSFTAGLLGGIGVFVRKSFSESKIVQWFAVGLAANAVALIGTFGASRLFSGRIRRDSVPLDREAESAFERELAVALENRTHEAAPAPPANLAANIAPRDASFAAQATTDKAAAGAAPPQRA